MNCLSDFINKNRKIIAGIFAFAVLAVYFLGFYYSLGVKQKAHSLIEAVSLTDDQKINYKTATLDPNNEIIQKFSMPAGEYEGVGIFMATYARENSGNVDVTLTVNGSEQNWSVDVKEIEDNAYKCMTFDEKITVPADAEAILTVRSKTDSIDKSPTVYTTGKTEQQSESGYSLTVNGEEFEETVCLKLYNGNNSFVMKWYTVFCGLMIAAGVFVFVLSFKPETKIAVEKFALITMISGVVLYSVIIPAFCVPDEMVHYESAYSLSNKMLFDFSDDSQYVTMRADDYDFIMDSPTDINVNTARYYRSKLTLFRQSSEKTNYPDTPMRNRLLAYLPSAIGISVGRIAQLGAYPTFILARLFNGICMCLIFWIAMKIIPFGKVALAMIGLLPMTLHLAGSVSYDPYTISFTLLMTAQFIKLMYKKETLVTRDYIETLAICLLAIPYKVAYFTVPLLAMLIPKENFKSKKSRFWGVCSFVLIGLIGIAILQLPSQMNNLAGGAAAGKNTYSLSQLIKNPLYTVVLLFRTLIANGSWYYECLIGKWLGWLNTNMPEIYIFIFTVLLVVSFMKRDGEEKSLKPAQKWFVFLAAAISSVAVVILLALDWTPASSPVILGVQGRYFTPLLLMVFLIIRNDTLVLKKNIDKDLIFYGLYFNFYILLNICKYLFTG